MLQRLISAKSGDIISVEVFDDVGLQAPSGFKIAEQTKTAIDRNPVSDKAEDLWKTFKNWANAVVNKKIDEKNASFELYITTKRDGKIVSSFHKASNDKEAESAYQAARAELVKSGGGKKLRPNRMPWSFLSRAANQ